MKDSMMQAKDTMILRQPFDLLYNAMVKTISTLQNQGYTPDQVDIGAAFLIYQYGWLPTEFISELNVQKKRLPFDLDADDEFKFSN